MMAGKIVRISGPVVAAVAVPDAKINDIVRVGKEQLLGEIIEIHGKESVIQVYEETDGMFPGEPVENTRHPLSVTLGPGLLNSVYDGVQRPLDQLVKESGNFIRRGIVVNSLDEEKEWEFVPKVKVGDQVKGGQIIGEVEENSMITHRIMIPPGVTGKITKIEKGKFKISDVVAKVGELEIMMKQVWPVKRPRPYAKKIPSNEPLITGQRVYDVFFPSLKGGQVAIPGPFGAGKTVTQQAIAKWCDAQIIVYVGCGERGNEMTDVLVEFPELKDPRSGQPLMNRTVLVANTSNMPVAAREASIYTGITIAEYFRDMGYDVALMADSTSRWAEAMREISGRLEEMPGEEGYPAYLAARLASFYERAGKTTTLNGDTGSVTVIGAVSPPGGDFSEPVTQNTLKIVKVFWALDAKLSAKRHYWAINWLKSYSLYTDDTDRWYNENVGKDWADFREEAMRILQREASLLEITQLVGKDALPESDQFLLLVARFLREDILQQNAFSATDMYCPVEKQYLMMQNIIDFYRYGSKILTSGRFQTVEIEKSKIAEEIGQMKYVANETFDAQLKKLHNDIKKYFAGAK